MVGESRSGLVLDTGAETGSVGRAADSGGETVGSCSTITTGASKREGPGCTRVERRDAVGDTDGESGGDAGGDGGGEGTYDGGCEDSAAEDEDEDSAAEDEDSASYGW